MKVFNTDELIIVFVFVSKALTKSPITISSMFLLILCLIILMMLKQK